jgi:hypothetical protein
MIGRRTPSRSSLRRSSFEALEPRALLASDSTVVINEIMYHPAGVDETLEYVELFNQLSYDMDVSGWQLADGVDYTFPSGTIVRRGQYLVVGKDPTALQEATGITGVLGPFVGSLANDGEEIELRNNSDRLMDVVDYEDHGAWAVGADGSGASLSKINEDGNGESAAAWQASIQIGGTPGAANFAGTSTSTLLTHSFVTATSPAKALVPTDGSLGLTWTGGVEPFDDNGWTTGRLGVGFDVNPDFDPLIGLDLQGAMHNQNGSAYVRVPFQVEDPAAIESLSLGLEYDDGAVVFLNGQEVLRRNTLEPASLRASYRLGEDDLGADAGVAGNVSTNSTGAGANLTRVGNPAYTSNTRSTASSLAMDFEDDDGPDV